MSNPEKIIILGVTGSVGDSALRVLRNHRSRFSLGGFSYHTNFSLATELQKEFSSQYITCTNPDISTEEREYWNKNNVTLFTDMEEMLSIEYDAILISVVGAAGVKATLHAADKGKKILLANKESLVMAGIPIMKSVRQNNAVLLPVDSEHNSLFRLLGNSSRVDNKDVARLIITASGGPFRNSTAEEIHRAEKKDVLNHPTWSMGQKITVDSASMVNKALETIEAHHLFSLPYEKLSAVIHSRSLVHAIVEHIDGTWSFHVNQPDMLYPVAHSFFYPEPPPLQLPQTKLSGLSAIDFKDIDEEKYPAFFLGLEAGRKGGLYPAIYNAANETAVAEFLRDRIRFTQIPQVIEEVLSENTPEKNDPDLESLFLADKNARESAAKIIRGFAE